MANETLLDKLSFSSTSGCQLEIGSGLGRGLVSASFLKAEMSSDLDMCMFAQEALAHAFKLMDQFISVHHFLK